MPVILKIVLSAIERVALGEWWVPVDGQLYMQD
jgi:hypothetical protein